MLGFFGGWHFQDILLPAFRNLKILHVACYNLSQIDVTKIVAPFSGNETFFKASALWADAFYKLKCPSVRLCVCPSVHVFTFEVPFKRLFASTSQSRMSNIFTNSALLAK
jgi:hypothetical protein